MKKEIYNRKLFITILLALLFSVMQITGYQISMYYGTSVHQSYIFQKIGILSTVQVTFVLLINIPVWSIIIYFLFSFFEREKSYFKIYSQNNFLILGSIISILLFVSWIPCFLAAYPGFYNYDAAHQLPQALYEEVPYSAHHPLLHTLVMGKIISFGYQFREVLNDGIALHSIFQMIFCSIAFSFCICYLLKITGKRWLAIISFCYYAFFPLIAMFSICTTKDVIFSVLLEICVILTYEMFKDVKLFFSSKKKVILFISLAVFMCLFRNNGIYIIVGMFPFVIFLCKEQKNKCLVLFSSIAIIYILISKGLTIMLSASGIFPAEALSVPMQQIARVYNEYGESAFEEKELKLIYEGISVDELLSYNPFLADNIKSAFEFEVVEGKEKEYLYLWIKKGFQYPKDYIQAFLDNTYQAWYPGTSIYKEPNAENTYYFHMKMHAGGERDTKAPKLLEFYNKIATEYYYQKLPVVRLFFSIGAMFWVALFTWSYAIYQKNKPLFMAMLPVLLCCGTVLLGPISLVRYYLVLFYGFPVSVGFLCAGNKQI